MNSTDQDREFTEEIRRIWNANAEWWDDRIGDGNKFQCELIEPTTESLLNLSKGDRILDVACGAGRFTRRMVELGAIVVAIDFSKRFIDRAKKRTPKGMTNIEYHLIDTTKEEQLLSLGINGFDAAVCTMALMDMETIEPLVRALAQLLKPGGRFVFSVSHPCFHSAGIQKFCEMHEQEAGRHIVRNGVKVSAYLTPFVRKTEAIIGQPETQYYFHRPLQILFEAAFAAGFVIDGFKEPGFGSTPETKKSLRWRDMPEIPPVLVVRMRLEKGN